MVHVLEPTLLSGGGQVNEFELKLAVVTAEILQCRYLPGMRQDQGAQGVASRFA